MNTIKIVTFLVIAVRFSTGTPLDDYVFNNSDLKVQKYQLIRTTTEGSVTKYRLNLTTCTWFEDPWILVDPYSPYWKHEIIINVPKTVDKTRPIFFFIDSGRLDRKEPNTVYERYVTQLSIECKCVTVTMKQVPNQPLQFATDPDGKLKFEDELVAWTFNMFIYLKTNFPSDSYKNLPLQFPMTKSVKRSFDVVIEFLKSKNVQVTENFIVSGQGKRGWTAWLIGAIDPRVIAVVPINFDILNWHKSFHSQFMSLGGGYSYAFKYYFFAGLPLFLDETNVYELCQLVDPYNYLQRFQGKHVLLISSTNSDYLMFDNTNHFWKQLKIHSKESYIRRLPNVADEINNVQAQRIFLNINNFILIKSKNTAKIPTFPKFWWKFINDAQSGSIVIFLSDLNFFDSYEVRGFYAFTKTSQKIDFRSSYLAETLDVVQQSLSWKSVLLASRNITINGTQELSHSFKINRSETNGRYAAFFVEVILRVREKTSNKPFVISTDMNRLPEYYPIGDCNERECLGKQV